MMVKTPDIYALVTGAAEGNSPLNAFDNALLEAGVGDTNLMRMSSILPPSAGQVEIESMNLPKGGLIPLAYANIVESTPGQIISSAVAAGIPEDDTEPGVIMEHSDTAPLAEVKAAVEQMVRDAFSYRGRKLREIKMVGAEHTVEKCGSTFAAVVLWYREG